MFFYYIDDDHSQGYAQIKEVFGALTKDKILQPYITDDDFRSSNAGIVEVRYNFSIFDIRYQQKFSSSLPVETEFNFDGVVPNDINGYALVLTNNLFSINIDGQRHFDLF